MKFLIGSLAAIGLVVLLFAWAGPSTSSGSPGPTAQVERVTPEWPGAPFDGITQEWFRQEIDVNLSPDPPIPEGALKACGPVGYDGNLVADWGLIGVVLGFVGIGIWRRRT